MEAVSAADILRRERDLRIVDWTDEQLVAEVASRVCVPRRDPADSFVLHAPLELMARAALLPRVGVAHRVAARRRLVSLLVRYEAWEPVPTPEPAALPDTDPDRLTERLLAALAAGELDDADAAAAALAATVSAAGLRDRLGDGLLPSLAAAAHAPIFLYHAPRLLGSARVPPALVRPLVRELARNAWMRLEWVERDRPPSSPGSPGALAAALVDAPHLDLPDGGLIFPLMHQVDASGDAASRLAPATAGLAAADAARVLLRHAARAMVVAEEAFMPYGWSHALTMTQGAVGLAAHVRDAQRAVDVAATFVLGFLAGEASAPVPPRIDLPAPGGPFAAARAAGRKTAAGWLLHATDSDRAAAWAAIVERAATAHDAHLAKYVFAVGDAAATDPPAAPLFVAAAGALVACWDAMTDADDPLAMIPASP
jgi:hypothetical protein